MFMQVRQAEAWPGAVVHLRAGRRMALHVLESGGQLPGLQQLLLDAVANAAWGEPSTVAHALIDLMSPGAKWKDIGGFLYAGLSIAEGEAHVSHAGDIRVAHFRGGKVANATRDHIVANDPGAPTAALFDQVERELHGPVVTRWLGGKGGCDAPDSVTWRVAPGDVLVVCTVAIHRHDDLELAEVRAALADRPDGFVAMLGGSP